MAQPGLHSTTYMVRAKAKKRGRKRKGEGKEKGKRIPWQVERVQQRQGVLLEREETGEYIQ